MATVRLIRVPERICGLCNMSYGNFVAHIVESGHISCKYVTHRFCQTFELDMTYARMPDPTKLFYEEYLIESFKSEQLPPSLPQLYTCFYSECTFVCSHLEHLKEHLTRCPDRPKTESNNLVVRRFACYRLDSGDSQQSTSVPVAGTSGVKRPLTTSTATNNNKKIESIENVEDVVCIRNTLNPPTRADIVPTTAQRPESVQVVYKLRVAPKSTDHNHHQTTTLQPPVSSTTIVASPNTEAREFIKPQNAFTVPLPPSAKKPVSYKEFRKSNLVNRPPPESPKQSAHEIVRPTPLKRPPERPVSSSQIVEQTRCSRYPSRTQSSSTSRPPDPKISRTITKKYPTRQSDSIRMPAPTEKPPNRHYGHCCLNCLKLFADFSGLIRHTQNKLKRMCKPVCPDPQPVLDDPNTKPEERAQGSPLSCGDFFRSIGLERVTRL